MISLKKITAGFQAIIVYTKTYHILSFITTLFSTSSHSDTPTLIIVIISHTILIIITINLHAYHHHTPLVTPS
eukprot:m.281769 g.281769  ORF g.281769 m.281769 type:complete len:73 (-) comp155532_c0_seq1:58-276(-)